MLGSENPHALTPNLQSCNGSRCHQTILDSTAHSTCTVTSQMPTVLSDESGRNDADLRCVVIGIAKYYSSNSVIYALMLDKDDHERIKGHPFPLYHEKSLCVWSNEEVDKANISNRSILRCEVFGDIFVCRGNTGRKKTLEEIHMGLDYGENVYKSIKEKFPNVVFYKENQGVSLPAQPESDGGRFFLVSLNSAFIKNERVYFETKGDERTSLTLNCREHFTLSASCVHLQMREVTSEDDVGDLALIRFGMLDACLRKEVPDAVCEALILKFKPKVISIDEEPVEITNGEGQSVKLPAGSVKFDTGNDAATAISRDLMEKLDLTPDRSKKVCISGIRDSSFDCFRVKINLYIRKCWYEVIALVDAVAKGTDLLIGNDIISELTKKNYSFGE